MANLTRASKELYRREPDECFPSLEALSAYCQRQKEASLDRWHPPSVLKTAAHGRLLLAAGSDGAFEMNDWSFNQLCSLAKVSKDTVNRLSPDTAHRVFQETLPGGNKPLQIFTMDQSIRSIHGTSYTRLHNIELLSMLREYATDFTPPQKAFNHQGTGLYCGEQDMFCFLIDPTGWIEIEGESFAPGMFVWNSEVGRRSLGIQTFWFQRVCANHIVWDAVEVVDFTRKHTASISDSLREMRQIIENLVAKRDQRRDEFAKIIRKAMTEKLGDDAEEVAKVLAEQGIPRSLAKDALVCATNMGKFTIFALIDALTRYTRDIKNAGDRLDADQKVANLLDLVAA
jgi:hypothetical protein